MKKIISTFLMVVVAAIAVPMLAGTVSAQKRNNSCNQNSSRYQRDTRNTRSYNNARYNDNYNDDYYGEAKQPNVYDRHRKIINIAGGAGAGALLGGLLGGKKGALIGAAAGAAGGAIITAKQAPRNYPRY